MKTENLSEEEMLRKADELTDKVLDDFLERGMSIAQSLGITGEELEALYTLGHQKYESGEYENAKGVFAMLCRLDPMSTRNMRALGSALQMCKMYQEAIEVYAMVLAIDVLDADASLHAGECLLLQDKPRYAIEALDGCIRQAKLNPKKYKDALERATLMRAKIPPPTSKKDKNKKK